MVERYIRFIIQVVDLLNVAHNELLEDLSHCLSSISELNPN